MVGRDPGMRYLRVFGTFLVLLTICCLLLFSIYNEVESKTISQINTEQMVHAQQGATGIERFFSTYNNTLSFLAVSEHIITLDPDGRVMMQEFYLLNSEDIASISRVDRRGTILYTFPFENTSGADISTQSHVQKSMSSHRVVVSDVFTAVQGFRTIAFAMPVFKNGEYDGSLTILVPFEQLSRKNLESIRILNTGHAWIINRDGIILYSPNTSMIDRSATTVFAKSPSYNSFIAEAVKGSPGNSTYTLEEDPVSNAPVTFHAVYFPAIIGDTHWSIIVATPEREILSTLHGFRNDLIIISLILVISLLLFAYYTTRAWGIIKEEEKRKTAEAALRESEANYRSILENMQETFYRGDKDGNLVMVSPSGVALMGYSSVGEMLGKKILSYYADPQDRVTFMQELMEKGSITNFETRLKKADGTVLTVLASSHIRKDSDGNSIGVEGIIRDITDRKQVQEELFRKNEELGAAYEEITATAEELRQNYDNLAMSQQALEQARRKLNLLNSVTFTDIQNAIFSLSGYLGLERLQPADEKTQKYREKQEKIIQAISASLQFAKNYQDLGIKSPVWQDVSQVFLLGISHIDSLKLNRKIRTDNLEIYADPLLEKVFCTLAENVLLHGVTATGIALWYRDTPEGLTLIFEDNGAGIPGPVKEKIFERRSEGKQGMGLFLVREILSVTGITITESGEPGKGARFEMVVPKGAYRFSGLGNPP